MTAKQTPCMRPHIVKSGAPWFICWRFVYLLSYAFTNVTLVSCSSYGSIRKLFYLLCNFIISFHVALESQFGIYLSTSSCLLEIASVYRAVYRQRCIDLLMLFRKGKKSVPKPVVEEKKLYLDLEHCQQRPIFDMRKVVRMPGKMDPREWIATHSE